VPELQILDPVVVASSISVMHSFVLQEIPSDGLLHDQDVFQHVRVPRGRPGMTGRSDADISVDDRLSTSPARTPLALETLASNECALPRTEALFLVDRGERRLATFAGADVSTRSPLTIALSRAEAATPACHELRGASGADSSLCPPTELVAAIPRAETTLCVLWREWLSTGAEGGAIDALTSPRTQERAELLSPPSTGVDARALRTLDLCPATVGVGRSGTDDPRIEQSFGRVNRPLSRP